MKIKSRKVSKKIIIIIAATLLVLIVISTTSVYLYSFHGSLLNWTPFPAKQDKVNYNPPSKQEVDNGNQTKADTVNGSPSNTNPKVSSGTENESTGDTTPQENIVKMTITAANQNSGTLLVRTLLETVTSAGQCTLTLTKSGASVTRTVAVQALANSSTCQGFDIPVSELSPGSWTLSVTYKNNDTVGSATQVVLIQ